MPDYVLTCCSTADLSEAHFQRRNIPYVCFHYTLDGEMHYDDLWRSMTPEAFYQAMMDGAQTRTSQVNINEYEAFWEPYLQDGKDILHVCVSSGISGTMNSAQIAADTLMKKYPGRTIRLVDSMAASSGYGLLMDEAADCRDDGMELEELCDWLENRKLFLHHWFFSSDLTFYIRGGRVSRAAGFIGKLISMCPLLNMDGQGCLVPQDKIRTKKKAIQTIVERMAEHARDGEQYNGKCYICHSACREDAEAVAEMIENRFPNLDGRVQINEVGATIGSHTGPGTVALFFWGDERVRNE